MATAAAGEVKRGEIAGGNFRKETNSTAILERKRLAALKPLYRTIKRATTQRVGSKSTPASV